MITGDIRAVMQNGVPALFSTCSASGEPNVSIVSQVCYVDAARVAISFQFFNKTKRNIRENPRAQIMLNDLAGLRRILLDVDYDHSETDGPVFDELNAHIEAIASATGMGGIFKLRAADIYRVTRVRSVPSR